jgi:hypothetical protein
MANPTVMKGNLFNQVFAFFMMGFVTFLLSTRSAKASFHLWDINEIYSNADGTVQFIELICLYPSQQFLNGVTITFTTPTYTHTFTFPSNVPAETANKTLLLGTTKLGTVLGLFPDFTLPTSSPPFIPLSTDGPVTISFGGGADTVTYTNLPTNGTNSLNRSGPNQLSVGLNSPKNFAGQSNSIAQLRFNSVEKSGGNLLLSFKSNNRSYALETKNNFQTTNWNVISNITGNGGTINLSIPIASGSNAFFRLHAPDL